MQTAPPTPPRPERREAGPTIGDMLWEVADLAGGAVVTLLPLLVLAVPSIVLLLPALVLLAAAAVPAVVAAAILVPTYLLARSVLRALGARRETHRRGRGARSVTPEVSGGSSLMTRARRELTDERPGLAG